MSFVTTPPEMLASAQSMANAWLRAGSPSRSVLHAAGVLLVSEKPGMGAMAVPSKLTIYFTIGKPVVAATDPSSAAAAEVRAAARQVGGAGKRASREILDRVSAIRRYEEWCRDPAASPSRMVRDR